MSKLIDITGKKYNMLTVISFYDIQDKKSRWLCECDCGNKKVLFAKDIKNGNTKSCGCLLHQKKYDDKTEMKIKRLQRIYYNMKQRCYDKNNPLFKYYGKRNIKIYNEWIKDINKFFEWALNNGYNDNLTIERIDVNRNYEPNNCKWITKTQQGYNKTNTVLYTIEGQTKCLSEWCKLHKINYHIVYKRLKRGKTIVEALTTPIDKKYRNKLCMKKEDEK